MQVLMFLIEHAGQNVTKDQIFKHVWNKIVVADDILSVAMSKIRKALGDNARNPSFIKTLPSVGYVLIAKVKKVDINQLEASKADKLNRKLTLDKWFWLVGIVLAIALIIYFLLDNKLQPTTQLNINSIAVLPFDDLSAQQDNQHFTDGLSDAILNQLSQTNLLKVISRYSSFTYRGKYNAFEVGQALQVEALLDGSVQKQGEQIRINIRIFSTTDGQQLWSKTFDSKNEHIFKLQDRISMAIQKVIQPNLSVRLQQTRSINAQAYEWYLMGQYYWQQRNPKALNKAVNYFKHSLELEPDYAEAHTGLAISYVYLHHYANWSEAKSIEKAMPHIEKALKLQPNSPKALATKGMLLTFKANYEAGFSEPDSTLVKQAEQAFIRSLELEDSATTHHWYSVLLNRLGKEAQVIQHMNQAMTLNPLSASLKRSYAEYLGGLNRLDSAQRMYQRAFILQPEHFSHLIEASHLFRHTPNSVIKIAQWQAENSELFITCASDEYCEQVAFAYLSIGAADMANRILDKMESKHQHFLDDLALINLSMEGQEQKILSLIEKNHRNKPNNKRIALNLATAQFRANQLVLANNTLLKLYPQWRDNNATEITPDNYSALVLYAATLMRTDFRQDAEILLNRLLAFLKQEKVLDKAQAELVSGEINALLGNSAQAIYHLEKALNMGWLTTYSREWWTLKNNHYFHSLQKEPEFKKLLKQHQEELNQLREQVEHILSPVSLK